jgi:hypothetical protein
MGDGSQANKMDVKMGRYMDGSLPVMSIAAEKVTPTPEKMACVQKCLFAERDSIRDDALCKASLMFLLLAKCNVHSKQRHDRARAGGGCTVAWLPSMLDICPCLHSDQAVTN